MKKLFCIVLSIIIFTNYSIITVFAVDFDEQDTLFKDWEIVESDESDLDIIMKNIPSYIQFLLSQTGITFCDRDMSRVWDDSGKWFEEHRKKMVVVKNKKTGEKGIKVEKSVTDELINTVKEATKEPENGGYELLKTVPSSKISSLYFDKSMYSATLFNLLRDNNGIIGLYCYYGSGYYYKIPSDVIWVKGTWKVKNSATDYKEIKFDSAIPYKNLTGNSLQLGPWKLKDSDKVAENWKSDNLESGVSSKIAYNFKLYDSFSFFVDAKKGINPLMQDDGYFIVTSSGASIPVFNTIDDAVAYSVANNLYYTGSNYTGEGKEIIIPFDEIDKILNGYYDGMYDMLQRLIEQQGNGLTPEQLQKLVDEVQTSFGMLKDTINAGFEQQDILIQKNSHIMQNIADALNAFFSQTKEYRKEFLKAFNDYAKDEKERDEMLYNLLSEYLEGKKDGSGGTSGGDTGDYYIKIKSVSNDGLDANQREFTIETNIPNPYYESCLTWYPLNGVSDIQYTNGNTAILTFFNYNKRYNVYCKYNDTGQNIRCTSNTASVTIGEPDSVVETPNIWENFIDNVYQFFTDIINKLDDINESVIDKLNEIFYDSNANNYFRLIMEDILIFLEQFQFFAADCLDYLKNITDGTGGNKQLPSLPSPDGSGKGWDFLEFLTDIAKDIAENSLDEGAKKVGSLITEILSGLAECFSLLSEVFPFSIPWDIAALVGALAREPETPHFEIPLKLEKYGIDEKIVIDLTDFEYVSKISRAFMSLIWAMYLMNFTVKFTDTKNL